jgi:hypothetical protein
MAYDIESEIHDAIIDATVTDTRTGNEVLDVSECYLALVEAWRTDAETGEIVGTGLTVEWGPCKTRRREAVENAPAWVWEAATRGKLRTKDGRVCVEGVELGDEGRA